MTLRVLILLIVGGLVQTGLKAQQPKPEHPGLYMLPFDQELADSIPNFHSALAAFDLVPNPSPVQKLLDGRWVLSTGLGADAVLVSVPFSMKSPAGKPGLIQARRQLVPWKPLFNPEHDYLDAETQLLRLADGSLLALKQGITWRALPTQPDWWNTNGLESPAGTMPGQRGCLFFYLSQDSGRNWTPIGLFDNAIELNGEFARPRNGYIGSQVFPGKYNPSAMKHIHLVADKWHNLIYLSMDGVAGLGIESEGSLPPERKESLVLVSEDRGFTWKVVLRTVTPAGPVQVMPLQDGRAVLVYYNGDNLVARVVKTDGEISTGPEQVLLKPGQFGQDNFSHLPTEPTVMQLALSRIQHSQGPNTLRLAVPFLNSWHRQGYQIYHLSWDARDPNRIEKKLITIVESHNPSQLSCVGGAFADPDTGGSTSLFAWMETTGNELSLTFSLNVNSDLRFSAHGCLLREDGSFTRPFAFSQEAGKLREWFTVDPNEYKMPLPMLATSFSTGDTVGFVAAWREEGDKVNYNVVVPRKPGAAFKPGVEWHHKSAGMQKLCLGLRAVPYLGLGLGIGSTERLAVPNPSSSYTLDITPHQSVISMFELGLAFRNGISLETGVLFQRSNIDIAIHDGTFNYSGLAVNQESFYSLPLKLKYTLNRRGSFWVTPFVAGRFNFTDADSSFSGDYFDRSGGPQVSVAVDFRRLGAGNPSLSSEAGMELSLRMLRRFWISAQGVYHLNSGVVFSNSVRVESQQALVLGNGLENLRLGLSLRHYMLQQPKVWSPEGARLRAGKPRSSSKPPKGFKNL